MMPFAAMRLRHYSPPPPSGDPAVVQSVAGGNSGTSALNFPVLPGSSVTGHTFVVQINEAFGQAGASAPTDTFGNTYTPIGTVQVDTNNSSQQRIYVCVGGTGGANHRVTLNYGGNYAEPSVKFIELENVSAVDTGSLVQVGRSSPPWAITSGTFSAANNLCLAFCGNGGGTQTYSVGSPFSIVVQEGDGSLYWTGATAQLQLSSTAAVTPSFTSTDGTQAALHIVGFAA